MKFLLIPCLVIWATVSANSETFRKQNNTLEQQRIYAQNQKTHFIELYNYISEIDMEIENISLSSCLLFNSFVSAYTPLFFELSINSYNNFYPPIPFTTSDQYNSKKESLASKMISSVPLNYNNRSLEKNGSLICWNKLTFNYYKNDKLSNYNSPILFEPKPKNFSENDFTYAGSERFTLSGDPPNSVTEIKSPQVLMISGIAIASGIALHINQSAAWWDGKGRNFYVKDDWDNALYADKFGHFMGGYFASYLSREAFVYSGFSWNQSILLGSLLGLLTETYVEFKDGYADNTGFSPSDFAADIAGVSYFYLQHYIPFLQNFSPKWQYSPPEMIGVPPKARTQTFLDNYNSTTAWVSVHVHNLFWSEKKSIWPRWLNIGLGYGINGYYTSELSSRFVIGIDFNIVELLPDGVPFWNWIKQSLNCIKFPAPAIEFTKQGTQFKLLYPFTLSVGSFQF
jgi:hypothetical protein